jgi:hypothetical protein
LLGGVFSDSFDSAIVASGALVRPVGNLPQPLHVQVRVDLGSGQACMPEHFLNRPKIGAVTRASGWRSSAAVYEGCCNAGASGPIFHDELGASGREPLTIAEVEKDRRLRDHSN